MGAELQQLVLVEMVLVVLVVEVLEEKVLIVQEQLVQPILGVAEAAEAAVLLRALVV